MAQDGKLELQAYITNLGKYVEGELIGKFVTFPVDDDELDKVYKDIKMGRDENGNMYDEMFITYYDGNVPYALQKGLGKDTSIKTLNMIGLVFEKLNEKGEDAIEQFEALVNNGEKWQDAAANVLDDNITTYKDCASMKDVAIEMVISAGSACALLGKDKVKDYYLDYEKVGQYFSHEYRTNPRDSEACEDLGRHLVEAGRVDDEFLDHFVDLKKIGRDIDLDGSFCASRTGYVELSNWDPKAGKRLLTDLEDELEERKENKGKEKENGNKGKKKKNREDIERER